VTSITLRSVKGSPLTNNEVDSNFNSLNVYKVELTDSTGSIIVPAGTTAERDSSPLNGYFRYNTDDNKFEAYVNNQWSNVGELTSSISYNTSNGTLTLTTSDSSYTTVIDLQPFSTTNLIEGDNQYFTTARARNSLVAGSGIVYDSATGVIATAVVDLFDSADFNTAFAAKTTDDLTEGTNLYYTTARADSAFDVRLTTKSTTDVAEGANLYYTTVRADSAFDVRLALKTTDDLTEGSTNLYYDSAAVVTASRNSISVTDAGGDGSLAYNAGTGVITYTGPSASEVRAHISAGTGVTITDGSIAIGQAVATTSDVTFAKITGDSAVLDQVNFNTSYAGEERIPFVEGAVWYDNYHKTLNYWADDSNVIHEIGTEEHHRVYNNSGSLIEKGKPLYYSGNHNPGGGAMPVPTVGLADATDVNAYNAQGLAAGNIANGSYGYIILSGQVDGINTSGLSAGDNFFVGLTPGAIQNASPVYPNYPMCLGWVVTSDSSDGVLIVNQQNHSVNSFRVRTFAHIGNDLIVDGNLLVNGTQTITSTENVSIGGSIQYLNAGNTIGEANTAFVGSGLDDAFFAGHYSGDSSSKSFYVKIDATGTPDTFEWGHDSAVGAIATGIAITGAEQILDSDYGISIDFGATTGHTLDDVWAGTAAAVDVDTGFFTNRNTGDAGSGYTHLGFFFDVSTNKWRLLDAYDPEPENPINIADSSLSYGDLIVNQVEGNLVGNVTGNVTGTVSDISNHTTDDLAEGSTNLYYDSATTVTVARNSIVSGTGITYTAGTGTIATNDGAIVHDNLSGFVSNEHIDHSTVTLTAGIGLSGGGDITTSRTFNIDSAELYANFNHDNFTGFVANEHIDHSGVTITAGAGLTGGGDITATRTLNIGAGTGITVSADAISTNDGAIVHDNLSGFVANEHIDHSGVTITAGAGLTGGGDITTSRTLNIGAGTGITVNADDIAISNTGVSAATYGDSSTIPIITVNAQGQITAVVGASVDIPAGYGDADVDAHLSGGTGITYSAGVISTNDGQIAHDNLSGFVANEHIDHSGVTITAGSGLTGGGTIAATRTLNVGAGSYIIVNADDVAVDATSANTASKVVARDASGNFSAGTITATLSGNASTATALQTARTIGGVSFDGTANINLPGVNTTGNQNTSGNAGSATYASAVTLTADNSTNATNYPLFANAATGNLSPRTDTGLTYNPSTGVLTSTTFSGALSGNASTATALQTARTIGGVSFDGTANINLPGVNTAGNQNTTGTAAGITGYSGTYWTSNNDGAASGLDADLLDGQHGSYYRIDVYNAAGTLLN
jgi:hypothetical protein